MLITYEPGSPAFPYYNVGNVLRIFGLGGKQAWIHLYLITFAMMSWETNLRSA